MPQTFPSNDKARDIAIVAELAIKERKIALPAKRIYFYCRYLGVKVSYSYVCEILRRQVEAGHLVVVHDGNWRYFKIRVR
jgi:hypothetical protein